MTERAAAVSEVAHVEGHGLARRGHIPLQDHGGEVWYGNIEVRKLEVGG